MDGGWWMVDGMAVVEGEVRAVVGGGRKEEWKANPDFEMERSGSSTNVEQSPTGEVPWNTEKECEECG